MNDPQDFEELRQYLTLLLRRRALLAACVAGSLLVALVYNATARPVFRATAQILIDRDPPSVLPAKGLADAEPGGSDFYQTQYELLHGRPLAERVVARLGLEVSPELRTGPLVTPWESLRQRLSGFPPSPPAGRTPPSPAAEAFRSRLTVEPVAASRLVNLHFRAYDPALAARAVNALAQLYIEQSLEFRFTTSAEASGWLSDHLLDQQRKVAQAEQALQRYREREGLVGRDGPRDLDDQRLSTLNAALTVARTDRIAKETLRERLAALSPSELDSFPPVVASPLVQGLKARLAELRDEEVKRADVLGDRHPEMIRLRSRIAALEGEIQAEVQNVALFVQASYRTAVDQETRLAAELEAAKRVALAADRKLIRLEALKREVEGGRQLLRELAQRARETGLESQLRFTNLRVVERAEAPRSPVLPRRGYNVAFALGFGLALGIGLAVLLERMDTTVKTPDDVTTGLGLPFLGLIPQAALEGEGEARAVPLVLREPQSAVAEAYRVLRTNLISCAARGHVVMVSSAHPGEGKTTTLANLGASFAQNGARVLMVDADLRRPALHGHFGLRRTPGLSDLIVDRCRVRDALQATPVPGLQVLPCGETPPNPAELLGSKRLRELIGAQRKRYDWIFVDAPPILAMADAPVLCSLVDGLVMVVWAESSSRLALRRALDQVQKVGGALTGVVLNKVDLERNWYYYGQYYGEYYRRYYGERTDAAAGSYLPRA